MANFIDIAVIGDKELQRKLKALDEKMQKKIVRKALRQAAKPVLSAARLLCPENTGRLRASLKLKVRRQKRGVFGVEVITGTRQELGIRANDPYYYPAAVEFGHLVGLRHRHREQKELRRLRKQGALVVGAHPFLRPALEMNRSTGIAIAARVIASELKREAVRQTTGATMKADRPRHWM